jgi:hypothetical protein
LATPQAYFTSPIAEIMLGANRHPLIGKFSTAR